MFNNGDFQVSVCVHGQHSYQLMVWFSVDLLMRFFHAWVFWSMEFLPILSFIVNYASHVKILWSVLAWNCFNSKTFAMYSSELIVVEYRVKYSSELAVSHTVSHYIESSLF